MKKFLLIAFIIAAGYAASAQQSITPSKATTTNADTSYMKVTIPGYIDLVSFQVVQTKTSGTVAGTAYLQGSLDGVNFLNIGADSLTFSDQAINTQIWTVSISPYTFYRVFVKTTNGVSVPSAFYLARKRPLKQY